MSHFVLYNNQLHLLATLQAGRIKTNLVRMCHENYFFQYGIKEFSNHTSVARSTTKNSQHALHNLPGSSTPQQRRTIVHHDVPSSITALASSAKKTPSFDNLKTYFVFAGLDSERFRHQRNSHKVMLMLLNYLENIPPRRLE